MRILTIFLVFFTALNANAADAQNDFNSWLVALQQEAVEAGVSPKTAKKVTEHISFIPSVIALDRAQPEFVNTFFDYYYQRVDALKIQRGKEALLKYEPLLNKLEAQYGVPKATLVAFWGMETNYGNYQGDIDTFSSLATLAYEGRRATFFRSQLIDAMRIVDAHHADVEDLHESFHGSWAGAFGHMQFMPSTFVNFAVDGDSDGSIDIAHSVADAMASAANYLSQVGWRAHQPVILEVKLPENFAWQNAQLLSRKPVQDWQGEGVVALVINESKPNMTQVKKSKKSKPNSNKTKKSKSKKANIKQAQISASNPTKKTVETKQLNGVVSDMQSRAAILLPQGWQGPAFMVFDNFDVMMDWNRSVNYALSVAQLAKRLNGEAPILGGQSAEAGGLSYQQMFDLQTMLNIRGFDCGEADGFPGLQTQAAARAYQITQKLAADGFASPKLLDYLNLH